VLHFRDALAELPKFNETLVQNQARVIAQRELNQLIEATRHSDQVALEMSQRWAEVIESVGNSATSAVHRPKPIRQTELARLEKSTSSHVLHGPLRDYRPPQHVADVWCRNELDAFVLDQLKANQVSPPAQADSRTLLRRAWLSLTGVPPSISDVETWSLQVDSNWETLVDYLLEHPDHGEHLATTWLDLVRYADSNGYEEDELRPFA
jgi:hypothetical protein